MRDRDEPDPLHRAAQDVLNGGREQSGLSDADLAELIAGAPYPAGTDDHEVFGRIAGVADRVMRRHYYSSGTVDAFYTRARDGQPGERAFVGGAEALKLHGYPAGAVAGVPDEAAARFLGLGDVWADTKSPRGQRILDVGCGAGVDLCIASTLSGGTAMLVGVDKRPELLPTAARACPTAALLVADVEALPFAGASFDLIIANGLPPLQRAQAMSATAAALSELTSPGGTIAATVLTSAPEITTRLSITHPNSHPTFTQGLALLITGKPTVEQVVRAFDAHGAVAVPRRGVNPYRDSAIRTRTALFSFRVNRR
ncbi:class I SAM-dependent methyltransferase [Prescottella agglutinans]|uniref:SAM-dependent methyltransferase n=1 Tax=Prescottella agglutinans TaxID=1644129 RepID=A0ABT6ML09_9NOCA|nr:class I SAM-dependent methyltransferase [Prescottella agglutinans]MDH6284920.1 SAM-dependent methyltransferase [Prescottella agglutinans]